MVTILAICSSAAAFTQTTSGNMVIQWDNAALQAIRDTHPGPPMVARALAIVHTCIFDAWAAYDDTAVGTTFGGGLRRPASQRTLDNKNQSISYAAYNALVDLYPSQKSDFDALMKSLGYDPSNKSVDLSTAAGVGNVAAQAVLEFRHRDGSNQLGDLHPGAYSDYTGYAPVNDPDHINDPGRWQPLRVSDGNGGFVIQTCIAPHWGNVIPFALTSGSQFRPTAGPDIAKDTGYVAETEEVIYYNAHLTDRQKVIAEYWADGPKSELPPGHWCLFAQFVALRDNQSVDETAKMFFAMTNAILDASIVAWDAKRVYDSVRPVTAVHYLKQGKRIMAWAGPGLGTQEINGEDWQPYQAATVVTPPFPEYLSGHSMFSAAGAEVLKSFTGSNILGASYTQPAGTSRVEPGLVPAEDVVLTWPTFAEAADEAGISRRYGGIHFIDADLDSRIIGKAVGAQAWKKAMKHFNGTAQ
ncbi:MAG: phosphatase PAP2 family protein [Acidobacteriota bacterium]|nr:phosphatase PAP2 family protein [Acidobacteriota bacterium]